ncbi:hypothetical protein ACJX0J_011733, partial [Zea mays]
LMASSPLVAGIWFGLPNDWRTHTGLYMLTWHSNAQYDISQESSKACTVEADKKENNMHNTISSGDEQLLNSLSSYHKTNGANKTCHKLARDYGKKRNGGMNHNLNLRINKNRIFHKTH